MPESITRGPGVHAADIILVDTRPEESPEICDLFSACDACAVLMSAIVDTYDLPSLSFIGSPSPR